jgi:hypothetical protein
MTPLRAKMIRELELHRKAGPTKRRGSERKRQKHVMTEKCSSGVQDSPHLFVIPSFCLPERKPDNVIVH